MINNRKIILIASIGLNNEIGLNNNLIWHLKKDLKIFKDLTLNNNIIMGKNTYLSLPGKDENKCLKNRNNIVLTKDKNFKCKNCIIANDIFDAVDKSEKNKNILIIGGESIYKQYFEYVDMMYITFIKDYVKEDVKDLKYFPEISLNDWFINNLNKFNKFNIIEFKRKRI